MLLTLLFYIFLTKEMFLKIFLCSRNIILFNASLTNPSYVNDFVFPVSERGEQNPEEGVFNLPSFLFGTRTYRHGQKPGHGGCLQKTGYILVSLKRVICSYKD